MGSNKRMRTPDSDSTLSVGSQGNGDWPEIISGAETLNSGHEAQNFLTSSNHGRVVTPEHFFLEYSNFPSAVPPQADVNQSPEHMAPVSSSFPYHTSNMEAAQHGQNNNTGLMQSLQNFDFLYDRTLYSAAKAMSDLLDDLIGPESSEASEGTSHDSDYKPVQRTPNSGRKWTGHARQRSNLKRSISNALGPRIPDTQDQLAADSSAGSFAQDTPLAKKPKLTGHSQLRNRNARTANDVDILEGLPVRQWKQAEAQIGPPQVLQPLAGKAYFPELPMPRDSHLLPEHSQHFLRLARAPTVSKPLAPATEDEENDKTGDDQRVKEANWGISISKWTQVPRHLEEPEREYLAKRRQGLPAAPSNLAAAVNLSQAGPMRKTKLKRSVTATPTRRTHTPTSNTYKL